MTLRPGRWKLHYQTALLAVLVTAVGVLVAVWCTSVQGKKALLEHELVDLRDETNLQAVSVAAAVTDLGRVLRALADTDAAARADGQALEGEFGKYLSLDRLDDRLAVPPAIGAAIRLAVDRVALVDGAGPDVRVVTGFTAVDGKAGPPVPPGPLSEPEGGLARKVIEAAPRDLHPVAETTGFVPGGAGCRLYLARRVEPRGGGPARAVVAAVDATRLFDEISRAAPRQVYFLLAADGSYLYHPDHGQAGRVRPLDLEDGAAADPARLTADRGGRVRKGHAPGVPFFHAKRRLPPVPPAGPGPAGNDPVKVFNAKLQAFARDEAGPGGEPVFRFARLTRGAVQVEVSHRTEDGLRRAEELVDGLVGDWGEAETGAWERVLAPAYRVPWVGPWVGHPAAGWHHPIPCDDFVGTVTLLPTGLGEPGTPARLVASAAVPEIEQDAEVAAVPARVATVLAVCLGGAVVAFLMTWYVTRPLGRIEEAAGALAAGARAVADTDADPAGTSERLVVPLTASGPPEVRRVAGAFRELVAQLERKADRLRQRSAELRSVFRAADDAIIQLSGRNQIVDANPAAGLMFGYDPRELVGLSSAVLLGDPPDSNSSRALYEYEARRRDGSRFWAQARWNAVDTAAGVVGTVIVRDITDRKAAEEDLRRLNAGLEERVAGRTAELKAALADREKANHDLRAEKDKVEGLSRAKDLFLATVSHELRAPLTVIGGNVQHLLKPGVPPDVRRRVERIWENHKYLTALVNDILDYMKIIEKKIDLYPSEFALGPFVAEVADEHRPRAEAAGNRVEVRIGGDAGAVVQDPVRVRQVLVNLLGNAVKFTRDGAVTVRCDRRPGPAGDEVVLAVSDTGRGISPGHLARLFQPFEKLHDRERNLEGTGLGLAICRGLCEQMGGTITAASPGEGRGATFTVTLPARLAGARPLPPPAPPPPPAGEPENRRVLVVDDDPDVRELVKTHLEDRGFVISTAASGGEALDVVRRVRPAVILLDILMPGGPSGWGVLAALKSDLGTAAIPVIMTSKLDDRTKGLSLGAADYITKPVDDWDQVAALIRKYQCGSRRVLVVDDDPGVRTVCREALARHGWGVDEAADGAAGLDRLRAAGPPDLIILDFLMPGVDGFRFLDEVGRVPSWAAVPVIGLTAKDLTEDDRRRLAGAVREVVLKAGDGHLDALVALVERHAGRRPG